MKPAPVIALLTDFGTSDAYVGTMKGVMLAICPHAQLVDLTHAIAPQNVRQAAYVLLTAYHYFPPDTVFLVVVDPGVGTARTPIAVHTDHGCYVAPDNGVLSYVLARLHVQRVVRLENPVYRLADTSQTFHGRDIFSPAAAHLTAGISVSELGPTLETWHTLPQPKLSIMPTRIDGEVLHIDHFGNIITSIGQLRWSGDTLRLDPAFGDGHPVEQPVINAADCTITVGPHTLHAIRRTYGAVAPGTLTALIGSTGQLEIGVNQGHAAQTLTIQPGDPVSLILTS
jgi:S-adenosyl-L-methionine hydrolase (adenosine-forming)